MDKPFLLYCPTSTSFVVTVLGARLDWTRNPMTAPRCARRILFPTVWVRYTYKLIWAELWHGKIAGIATSHRDRKRRTGNEKWGQTGNWSRHRRSVQFRSQDHIWIMKCFLIHYSALIAKRSVIFEASECWLSIIRESVIVVNKACPGTYGRLIYYNRRPLLSGIVALILRKLR